MTARKARLLRRLDDMTHPLQTSAINRGLIDWLRPAPVVEVKELGDEAAEKLASYERDND